jgi:hypothetical protein
MNTTILPRRFRIPALSVALIGLLLAQPAALPSGDQAVKANRIAGLWLVRVTLTNCATGQPLPFPGATFDAMGLFEADGTFHDTNANSPLLRSASFGVWDHLEGRRYQFAFRAFQFDSTGTLPAGSQIVRHEVVMSPDGQSYASEGTAEFYDVHGVRVLPDGCSTSTAQRFN